MKQGGRRCDVERSQVEGSSIIYAPSWESKVTPTAPDFQPLLHTLSPHCLFWLAGHQR